MSNSTVVPLTNGHACPCDCGGAYRAVMTPQKFPYGEGASAIVLEAVVPVWTCDSCDDAYTDGDGEKLRHAAVCRHLGRLSPDELTTLRVSRGMTQEEWADYTAIGIASIKRWETGVLIQNASTDRFLRLLADNVANGRYLSLRISSPVSGAPSFRSQFSEREFREAASFQLRLKRA